MDLAPRRPRPRCRHNLPARGHRAFLTQLERRLTRAERASAGKLDSLDTLRELTERLDIFSPVAGRESLEIDDTALAPEEVARLIVRHYHLPAAVGHLPAAVGHLPAA